MHGCNLGSLHGAATAALIQPYAGRALDTGRVAAPTGLTIGLLVTAAGLGCAAVPGIVGVPVAAVLIGAGTGLITPLGFAVLAASTPQSRLGQTMGTAELGRELGDAGEPLLVAAVATAATLATGHVALAIFVAVAPITVVVAVIRQGRLTRKL